MKLALSRVAQFLVASESAGIRAEAAATGYSIDSRTIQPGELFFAVKGEKMDGHDFVAPAIEKGAVAAVVSRDNRRSFLLIFRSSGLGTRSVRFRLWQPVSVGFGASPWSGSQVRQERRRPRRPSPTSLRRG
jgi:hypothetical protein